MVRTVPVQIMGILNATPDSFSDGGRYPDLEARLARGRELAGEGADLVDVGGESGVTHRPPVPEAEERARVVPLAGGLAAEGILVSVDTWKASVADAALAAGARIVNDVSGLRDPGMLAVCARHGAGLVITHTRAEPKVKAFPAYEDVVADVAGFLAERLERALAAGVPEDGIWLDPGLDMAKTPAQSAELLRRLPEVVALGRPVLLAVSRKDFVGAATGRRPRERGAGTLAAVGAAADGGAEIVRVHDVAATVDYLAVRGAIDGSRSLAPGEPLAEDLRREPLAPTGKN